MRPRETLCSRRCPGAFRAAPQRAGGTRNAARRQRRTDRAGGRADLRSPCFRAHAAVRAGAGALSGFDCASCGEKTDRCPSTCARSSRRSYAAACLSTASCAWCASSATRNGCGVFMQEARVMPELRRTPHGRECAAPGGGGVRPAAGAAMGAECPGPFAKVGSFSLHAGVAAEAHEGAGCGEVRAASIGTTNRT